MIGVYVIKCTYNNKFYIGVSKNIEDRWREHKSDLRNNKHHCHQLQRCCNKYGIDSLEHSVIYEANDYQTAINLEAAMLKALDCEYMLNSVKTNYGFSKEYKHSEETKRKISKSLLGNTYTLGYKHTAEAKQKQRIASMTNPKCVQTQYKCTTVYVKDGVKYYGSFEASNKTQVPRTTLMRYAKANKNGWSVNFIDGKQ